MSGGPVHFLFSYYHYQTGNALRDSLTPISPAVGFRVLLDSGAFSAWKLGATVRLPELIAWYQDQLDLDPLMIGLDVIGDAPATRRNCEAMRDAGLAVMPTVHLGADPKLIRGYAAAGWDYLGLGGLVNVRVPFPARAKWIRQCQREAGGAGVKLHGLGWTPTGQAVSDTLRRFATVDSSSYVASTRWGTWRIFDGRKIVAHRAELGMRTLMRVYPHAGEYLTRAIRYERGRGKGDSAVLYALTAYSYHRWGQALGTPIYLAGGSGHSRTVNTILNELIQLEKERAA